MSIVASQLPVARALRSLFAGTKAMFRFGEQPWVGRAAVEQRQAVPIGPQGSHYVAPDELGPADHEDLHEGMLRGALGPVLVFYPLHFVAAAW